MNITPFHRQNWVKREVSSLPLLLQKSSKPEVRFWVHSSTGCWFVFYCAYFLFGWFGFGGGGVGFFWEGYARQLVCMYEVNTILLSTDKTQKQNMDNHKCQEKKIDHVVVTQDNLEKSPSFSILSPAGGLWKLSEKRLTDFSVRELYDIKSAW